MFHRISSTTTYLALYSTKFHAPSFTSTLSRISCKLSLWFLLHLSYFMRQCIKNLISHFTITLFLLSFLELQLIILLCLCVRIYFFISLCFIPYAARCLLFGWLTKFRSQTITISKITTIIYIKNSNHSIIIISMCHHQLVIAMKLTIYRTATITIAAVLITMPTQQMPMVWWQLCPTYKMVNNKIECGKWCMVCIDGMHFNRKLQ